MTSTVRADGLDVGSMTMRTDRSSDRTFVAASTLLFAASAGALAVWRASMPAMAEMPMPGGWTMSMTWMRQPGQSWSGAAGSFVVMWVVMTVAMMLPSLIPTLCRYRESVRRRGQPRVGRLTAAVGFGYLFVWTAFGIAVFPLGVALMAVVMTQPATARAVPMTAGLVVLTAGAVQFTKWKAHHLLCCRELPKRHDRPANFHTAWDDGVRLGLHCSYSSAGFTAILLVAGVMNPGVMAVTGLALTAERLMAGDRVSRGIGAVAVAAGLLMLARAAGRAF